MLHVLFAIGCCTPVAAGAATLELRNPTTATSAIAVGSDGHTLIGTTGEAVAGAVVAGPHRLSAGFPATLAAGAIRGDHLFADGFEGAGELDP